MEDKNMITEMANEQAADVAANTTGGDIVATVLTTVGIGVAGYLLGKVFEWAGKKLSTAVANAKQKNVVEALPEATVEEDVVD